MRVYHGTSRAFDDTAGLRESSTGGNYAALNVPHDGVWATASEQEAWAFVRPGPDPRVFVLDVAFRRPFTSTAQEYADEGIASLTDLEVLRRAGHDGVIVERAAYSDTDFLSLVALPTWVVVLSPTAATVVGVLRARGIRPGVR